MATIALYYSGSILEITEGPFFDMSHRERAHFIRQTKQVTYELTGSEMRQVSLWERIKYLVTAPFYLLFSLRASNPDIIKEAKGRFLAAWKGTVNCQIYENLTTRLGFSLKQAVRRD